MKGNDKQEQITEIIKFFAFDSAAKWASETKKFKGRDLKDETVKTQYLQDHLKEKQRLLSRLHELAESELLNNPGVLQVFTGRALPSEVVLVLAQASVRKKPDRLMSVFLKNFKRVDTRAKCAILRAVACSGGATEYSFIKNVLLEEKEDVAKKEAYNALEAIFHKEPLLGLLDKAKSGECELRSISAKECPEMVQRIVQYFSPDEQIKILDTIQVDALELYEEVIKEIKALYDRLQKDKTKAARPNELALLLASRREGPELSQKVMREAARFFWGNGKEARGKILQAMRISVAVRFLRSGLQGTVQQAAAALEFLRQERRFLDESILQEIYSLCAGDNLELCRLTGELLLSERPEYINRQRWLFLRLASLAGGEEALEKRMPLVIALAGLSEKQQAFHLENCRDRDDIVKELVKKGKFPELLSLLRSSLQRWQPEVESTVDLVWLTKTFVEFKKKLTGCKAKLNLKSSAGDMFQADSTSYMKILLETQSTAAAAWHRCLRGPGGGNIYLANPWVFADTELAAAILDLLAKDPVAYATLVKEAMENSAKERLDNLLVLEYLLKGILASEYCLTNLLGECLLGAAGDAFHLNEINSALATAEKRLLPFLQSLSEDYYLEIKSQLKELLKIKEKIYGQVVAGTNSVVLQIKNVAIEPGITPKARILEVYSSELQYTVKESLTSFKWEPGLDFSDLNNAGNSNIIVQRAASLLMEINRVKTLTGTLETRFLNYLGQSIGLIIEKIQLWLTKNQVHQLDAILSEWLEELGFNLIVRPGEIVNFDPVLHVEQGDSVIGATGKARSTGLKGPDGTVLRRAVIENHSQEVGR